MALAHKAVLRISNELESIKRLSEVAVAAAAFGVDKEEAVARGKRIAKRAETLKQVSVMTQTSSCHIDQPHVRRNFL